MCFTSQQNSIPIAILLFLIINVVSLQFPFCNGDQGERVSALFVFGDSIVDPGNNNYLPTLGRANFPPYGKDFVNHEPTGRFCNGRLLTDFIASFLGVKENLPPYLDPTLTVDELMTGVSFASSGAGYDPFTSQLSGVLTASQQLELFREYKRKMEVAIGKERTDDIIRRAGYVVCSGTNDLTLNYYGPVAVRRNAYPTLSIYQKFLWQKIESFFQGLLNEGAKNIWVFGLPPIGCLPAIITMNTKDLIFGRQCIESYNSISRNYNQILENNLKGLQRSSIRIVYVDLYSPIINMVQGIPQFEDFEEVDRGCCGTGLFEVDYTCNIKSPVCSNVSRYLFWDSFHPTERGYYNIFKSFESVIRQTIE